jgi:hypothetical protein
MNEKFSEITTRQNKINLLKSKIRDEIKEDEINIKLNMKILLEYNGLNYDAWKCCVDKAFFLERLKKNRNKINLKTMKGGFYHGI